MADGTQAHVSGFEPGQPGVHTLAEVATAAAANEQREAQVIQQQQQQQQEEQQQTATAIEINGEIAGTGDGNIIIAGEDGQGKESKSSSIEISFSITKLNLSCSIDLSSLRRACWQRRSHFGERRQCLPSGAPNPPTSGDADGPDHQRQPTSGHQRPNSHKSGTAAAATAARGGADGRVSGGGDGNNLSAEWPDHYARLGDRSGGAVGSEAATSGCCFRGAARTNHSGEVR